MKTLKTLNYLFVGSLTAATLGFGPLAQAQNACTDLLEVRVVAPRYKASKEEVAEKYTQELLTAINEVKQADKINDKVSRLERVIEWFRKRNGPRETLIRAQERRTLQDFNSYILSGEGEAAAKIVRNLYKVTELAYEQAVHSKTLIDRIEREIQRGKLDPKHQSAIESSLKTLNEEHEASRETFMKNFADLQRVETLLQRTIESGTPQNSDRIVAQYDRLNLTDRSINKTDELPPTLAEKVIEPVVGQAPSPKPHEIAANENFIEAAKYVLESVGNYRKEESVRNLFAKYEKSYGTKLSDERPSFSSMDSFYQSIKFSSAAHRALLWKQLRSEVWLFAKMATLVPQIMKSLEAGFAKLPSPLNMSFLSIVKLRYDQTSRDLYLGQIQEILRFPLQGAGLNKYSRLLKLMEFDAVASNDHFLITFARVTNSLQTWDALKAQVQAIKDGKDADYLKGHMPKDQTGKEYDMAAQPSVRAAAFFKRMEAAEKAAEAAGPMSLFHSTPTAIKTGILLWSGGSAGAYLYMNPDKLSTVIETLKMIPLAGN